MCSSQQAGTPAQEHVMLFAGIALWQPVSEEVEYQCK